MSEQRHRIVIDSAFRLGDVVKLRVGEEADARGMVTGFLVRPSGLIYQVNWSIRTEQPHYEMELQLADDTAGSPA